MVKQLLRYFFRYWFWALSRLFSFVYLRTKFNLVVENKDQKIPKRPFFIVSNHGTFFDPWLVGHLSPYPLSIMMNEEGFKASKFVQWYTRNIGAYPKKKGESDLKAMRYTLQTLKEGYPVLIFPEGQTTWDGQTQPIYGGIESIIKRAKIPLVMMNITGNFISKPWWSETYRKGKVRVKRKILSPEELTAMSKQELRDTIVSYISNNDLTNEENLNTEFSGPPATDGLSRFVWICPNCKKEDTLITNTDSIRCGECNGAWTMDTHFRFTPTTQEYAGIGNLYDWSCWHKQMVKDWIGEAAEQDVLTTGNNVEYVDVTDLGEYPVMATGTLTLTKEKLTFSPTDGGSVEQIELPVEEINDYVFQLKTIFECRWKGNVYKFRIPNGSPMKWVFYFRYLNNYEESETRGYI